MMRVALINPNWNFDGSIYFGCRSPHLPMELGISEQYLRGGRASDVTGRCAYIRPFRSTKSKPSSARSGLIWSWSRRRQPISFRAARRPNCAFRKSSPLSLRELAPKVSRGRASRLDHPQDCTEEAWRRHRRDGRARAIRSSALPMANAISQGCASPMAIQFSVNGGPQAVNFKGSAVTALAGRDDPAASSSPSPL